MQFLTWHWCSIEIEREEAGDDEASLVSNMISAIQNLHIALQNVNDAVCANEFADTVLADKEIDAVAVMNAWEHLDDSDWLVGAEEIIHEADQFATEMALEIMKSESSDEYNQNSEEGNDVSEISDVQYVQSLEDGVLCIDEA